MSLGNGRAGSEDDSDDSSPRECSVSMDDLLSFIQDLHDMPNNPVVHILGERGAIADAIDFVNRLPPGTVILLGVPGSSSFDAAVAEAASERNLTVSSNLFYNPDFSATFYRGRGESSSTLRVHGYDLSYVIPYDSSCGRSG